MKIKWGATEMEWFIKRTLGSILDTAAANYPDREALVFEGERWTFSEWQDQANRIAKGLMSLGIGSGDRVALWMTNRPEWLFALFGIAKTGACVVPLNTRYRAADIGYALAQSESAVLLTISESGPVSYADILTEAGISATAGTDNPGFPELKHVFMVGASATTCDWNDLVELGARVGDAELEERATGVDPDSPMMIGYTSGTTASPKGVMHSHITIRNTFERAQLLGMTHMDTHLNYLPLFHIYGLSEVTMIAVLTGARQILMDSFDADKALTLAEHEQATVLHGFEAHWLDLLRAQESCPRQFEMRIGTLPSGVESTIPIANEVQCVFGPTVSGFGMTECWAFITVSNPSHSVEQRVNTSGYPMIDYEIRIVDPQTGTTLGTGEKGEIWIRGYAVMQGYWNKPEETASAFTDDGWLRSGDLGLVREDGNLVFLGRYKDMLKVGGENVSPAEVEAYIREMPEIQDVAVVAFPDKRLTEVPVAFVLATDGASVEPATVIARCKGQIASFKIPRHVLVLDAMPMTPSGKIRKVELREMALELLGARGS